MIVLDRVSKSFNSIWAVKGLDLTVSDGELFGLLGPNAAGKTTTIKMLTGLIKPTEGKILINGYDIVKESLQAKSVFGYVPDKAFFYEKLKGREFLIFVASLHNIEKSKALTKIDKMLVQFGIDDIRDELIESYSQGMRQRLLFLSSLIHNPKVLFIDEPFVGLDPFGVTMLKDMMMSLCSEGVTIFLATHSLHIAEELCERVGLISRGSLLSVMHREEFLREGGLQKVFLNITS
ncbi:MAG TPA: ABC transporter ATP-binding protein [Candidatus Altiarchaeales archaeon]|nr:ABC transporter ATP-binding protein [Candidatus Altiarchaeales archaeon]